MTRFRVTALLVRRVPVPSLPKIPNPLLDPFIFGLLLTIRLGERHARTALPALVACWIVAAYWFTASTSFANPAVAIARGFSNTFAGIRPADVPAFVLAEIGGALVALALFGWLLAPEPARPAPKPSSAP